MRMRYIFLSVQLKAINFKIAKKNIPLKSIFFIKNKCSAIFTASSIYVLTVLVGASYDA